MFNKARIQEIITDLRTASAVTLYIEAKTKPIGPIGATATIMVVLETLRL